MHRPKQKTDQSNTTQPGNLKPVGVCVRCGDTAGRSKRAKDQALNQYIDTSHRDTSILADRPFSWNENRCDKVRLTQLKAR